MIASFIHMYCNITLNCRVLNDHMLRVCFACSSMSQTQEHEDVAVPLMPTNPARDAPQHDYRPSRSGRMVAAHHPLHNLQVGSVAQMLYPHAWSPPEQYYSIVDPKYVFQPDCLSQYSVR